MKQIELYVPLADNDGNRISDAKWHHLRVKVTQHFPGFSTYDINGQWACPDGQVFTDRCKVYRILVAVVCIEDLESIARYIRGAWSQETVLYTVSDIDAVFV